MNIVALIAIAYDYFDDSSQIHQIRQTFSLLKFPDIWYCVLKLRCISSIIQDLGCTVP